MNNERLNSLFQEIREEKVETSIQDVSKWIALSSASVGLFGLLSKFKLSFLVTKKIIIMSSITALIGIGVTSVFLSAQPQNTEIKTPKVNKSEQVIQHNTPQKELKFENLETTIKIQNESENKADGRSMQMEIGSLATNPLQSKLLKNELPTFAPSTIQRKSNDDFRVEERQVGDFSKLKIGSSFNVYISQGDKNSVKLEVDEKYIDMVETKVNKNQLEIGFKKGSTIKNPEKMDVYINMKTIEEFNFSGAVNVSSTKNLNFEDLEIESSGAAEVKLELSGNSLKLNNSGAANIKISSSSNSIAVEGSGAANVDLLGSTKSIKITASGACNLNLKDLESQEIKVIASGAAKVSCKLSGKLKATASGASRIKYSGNPIEVEISESGAAKISKKG